MTTREHLRRRPDVPEADVDDVIGVAFELQEADRAARGATVEEVRRVADELDVDPSYVEAAIAELHRRREADDAAARARVAGRRRLLQGLASALAVVLLLAGGVGLVGAAGVDAAAAEARSAETRLRVVLERQATLAPQLVALGGGDAEALTPLADALAGAPTIDEQLRASARLGQALATALGALPPVADGPAAQQRLELHAELTGTQNRITAEARRLEEARLAWAAAAEGGAGAWAVRLGLADAPR